MGCTPYFGMGQTTVRVVAAYATAVTSWPVGLPRAEAEKLRREAELRDTKRSVLGPRQARWR